MQAHLIQGALYFREGRLEKAAAALREAERLDAGALALRSRVVLARVWLELGQPEKALEHLEPVHGALARFERLLPEEQTWVKVFVGDPADLLALEIQARLDAAWFRATGLYQQPPRDPALRAATLKRIRQYEADASRLLERLPTPGPQDRRARLGLAAHQLRFGRLDLAEVEVNHLQASYPADADVLRLRVALLAKSPSKGSASPEALFKQFLQNHPDDLHGHFLWVEWLTAAGRSAEALGHLDRAPPLKAAAGRPEVLRLRAAALARSHQGGKAAAVLNRLNGTDNLVPKAVANPATPGADRQEGDAHCDAAWLALTAGDLDGAARSFTEALEFARVRDVARQGLLHTLFTLAQHDPNQARRLTRALRNRRPEEPSLLLGTAFAALQLDDLGDPDNPTTDGSDLASALHAWEQAVRREQRDWVNGPLTRAQFWLAADRPDHARAEACRALREFPNHPGLMTLAAQLALESHDPSVLADGWDRATTLVKLFPRDPQPFLLRAELERRQGKFAAAVSTYEALLARQPTCAAGYARLVEALEHQQDFRAANRWVQRWRRALPQDALAVQAQVRLLARAGLTAKARELANDFYLQQSTPEAGKDGRCRTLLLLANGFLAGHAWDVAEFGCQKVLAEQPESEDARLLLGDVYLARLAESAGSDRVRWAAQARQVYTAVLDRNPRQTEAANNLAWLLVREYRDPTAAYQVLHRALATGHGFPAAHHLRPEVLDTLGDVYHALGKASLYPQMGDLYEAACRRHPRDPRMGLHLGRAYAGLGHKVKALIVLSAALRVTESEAPSPCSVDQRQALARELQTALRDLDGERETSWK